jgi:hypothetical protein
VCLLGRALICEEGGTPHSVIHPHLIRHCTRHRLDSAGKWNSLHILASYRMICSMLSAIGYGSFHFIIHRNTRETYINSVRPCVELRHSQGMRSHKMSTVLEILKHKQENK